MRNAILVILLALPVGWFAFGQSGKKESSSSGSLTSAQVGQLLKELGYEPVELADDVHQVSVNREGWKVHIMISLTQDGERIWLESKFAPIADPEAVPAMAWRKLLEENDRISPAHFTFEKSDKRIHLYKAFDNVGLTPARLKKELDGFDAVARRTQSVWRAENFAPAEVIGVAPRAVEPSDAEILRGRWRIVRIENKGESTTEEQLARFKPFVAIEGESAILKIGADPERKVTVRIDAKGKPKQIDFIDEKGRVETGIYLLETGLLTVCVAGQGEERPRQFVTDAKNRHWLLVLKRDD
jgi:uncharacterized protein (TIGR03067 family)